MRNSPTAILVAALATTLVRAEARADGRTSIDWRTPFPHDCPTRAAVDGAVQSRLRRAALREDLQVAATASWTGARWRVVLAIRRGGVAAQTTHEGDTCHAVAAAAVQAVLREARGVGAGPVEETALFEFVVPGEPGVRAPRTRYEVCDVGFLCPGIGLGVSGGTSLRWRFAGGAPVHVPFTFGVQTGRWFSDDWAFGFGGVVDTTLSFAVETWGARRLLGSPPLDPGARLVAVGGVAVWGERRSRTDEAVVRPGLRAALRGEVSLGPMVAWADVGAQATTAWVELVAFAGLGYRLREAVPEPR